MNPTQHNCLPYFLSYMKPLFPVLLLLAFCLNAAAQSTKQIDTAKQRDRKAKLDASYQPYAEGRMTAKINFLSLIDPETPTIQTGIEYRFSKRVSGEFTYGIPVKIHGDVRPTDSTYYRYSKFRIEIRYFPFERKAFYLAPEATFISKERSKYDGSYYGKDGEDYTYDYAEIDKSIVAGALKFGLVTPFRKNNR